MNKFNMQTLVIAVGLVFSAGAMAQNLSKTEYMAGKDRISGEYKAAKMACGTLAGNANDVCESEVAGKEKIALAEIESSYKPTSKNHYLVGVAKAEAAYEVAKEKCDDQAGNAKDVCVKEAKAVETAGKADAKQQMKATDAKAAANAKSANARAKAKETTAEARKDSMAEKSDAEYAVAKEKCDTFAGGAKDKCLDSAKLTFGKS